MSSRMAIIKNKSRRYKWVKEISVDRRGHSHYKRLFDSLPNVKYNLLCEQAHF